MASPTNPKFQLLTIFLSSVLLRFALLTTATTQPTNSLKDPTPWPSKFHALLFKNNSGGLQVVDFWYDWSRGGSLGVIQNQLQGSLTYERAFNNGTSFIYPLGSENECVILEIPSGTLQPDWLRGAEYRGRRFVDGFLCDVWEKVGLIWYYEDAVTKNPVYWSWISYPGFTAHVMAFDVGVELKDSNNQFQAPPNCFLDLDRENEQ